MHALVFAAGRGTRLRPRTDTSPKPLLDVAGEPLLAHCLRSVVDAGIDELVLVVGYRAEDIVDAIGDSFEGVPVSYAHQREREGLAHAVCEAADHLSGRSSDSGTSVPDDVMTVNGDNVFDADCDLSRLVERHHQSAIDGTVLLDRASRNESRAAARCERGSDGRIESIETAPGGRGADSGYIAAGVQTHDGPALVEACRAVDRAETGEYELVDALVSLVDDGMTYAGVDATGWHLNVNTPTDLSIARRRLGTDTA